MDENNWYDYTAPDWWAPGSTDYGLSGNESASYFTEPVYQASGALGGDTPGYDIPLEYDWGDTFGAEYGAPVGGDLGVGVFDQGYGGNMFEQGYGDAPSGGTNWLDTLLSKGGSLASSLLSGGSNLVSGATKLANDKDLMNALGLGAGAAGTLAGYFGKQDDKKALAERNAQMMAQLDQVNPTALGEFDPTKYINPYNQAVKAQTLRDLGIQQAQQAQAQDAAAVSRGAFGGRRADLLRQEGDLQRNLAYGRMAQELDQKGFDTSADVGLKVRSQDLLARDAANNLLLKKAGIIGNVPVQTSSTSDIAATLAALGGLGTGVGARQNPNEVK